MDKTFFSATIRLDEGLEIPEVEDTNKPTNIMSAMDGQIVGMDIYHGTPQVQIGDAVTEGRAFDQRNQPE